MASRGSPKMSHSLSELPPQVEDWTLENVHQWLVTVVKVGQTCADKFVDGDVLGEYLIEYDKQDILDLRIKHGPAVKIKTHLENLKKGKKYECPHPKYVEKWTKEQVYCWLLHHVKIYSKYAEQLKDEDVSGDCLVCFDKKDLMELGVKSGPAVKIHNELDRLKNKPEPPLQPIHQSSTDQPAPPKTAQTDMSSTQATATCQPLICDVIESKRTFKTQPDAADQSVVKVMDESKTPQKQQHPKPKPSGPKRGKEQTRAQPELPPHTPESSVRIYNILAELAQQEFKEFLFHLEEYRKSDVPPIPRAKLEKADRVDTAQTINGHYGPEEALQVTCEVLHEIKQLNLVKKLESHMGQLKQQSQSKDALSREGNQGDKLQALLTCGGSLLDYYDRYIVVVNKSSPEQVQHLEFLTKLQLFCVLDFDPDSVVEEGLCHSYRETRLANLHSPSQYQGQIDHVIKNLNLFKQTSWVFCNGRNDLLSDSNVELDYQNWLRNCCDDVEQLVSFLCNPDVLLHGKSLIVFLLLSPVETDPHPFLETYRSFLKKKIPEKNIISICESENTYKKWRELILKNFDCDIDPLSVYELTLSEINGTVLALGPFSQSSQKLLPSSGSSAVVLRQKDEDEMTALDILCLNECEKVYDESTEEFNAFKTKVEEDFYRGGKVKWWNFYLCDKDSKEPFVKRQKYEKVKDMIISQWANNKNSCVLVKLFHQPGCGGTTLAMHVLWDLRKIFRCAVVKDTKLPGEDITIQVQKLLKLESDKASPVLLLVDDSKATENLYHLETCIRRAVEDFTNTSKDDAQNCKVIILNVVRTHCPQEQYKQQSSTQLCQFITASLTQDEKRQCEEKFEELKKTHEKPENFYTFMFMKSNFDQKYIDDLALNTLESFNWCSKEAQLFAFLALLNTYVAESALPFSLCEDFLGIKILYQPEDSVLDRMKPYSNFVIKDTFEDDYGEYKGIRILHHTLASACLDELERSCLLKVSEIVLHMLYYDLFFIGGLAKHRLMPSIQRMLIERQRKKGEERHLFSPLIDKINKQQGRAVVQKIFEEASSKFETSASIPQALARYLYINERDFVEALKWAEKAKDIKENPYTFDTIGQVHKNHLKSNIEREKQERSRNPEALATNMRLAVKSMTAFNRAQELYDSQDKRKLETPDDDDDDDESVDCPRNSYNIDGHVRVLEIGFLVFEILSKLPFFKEDDPMKKRYLISFLMQTIPINSVFKEDNETNNRYVEIIKDHEHFIVTLKSDVKDTFDFLSCYFNYIKGNSEFDRSNYGIVCDHFKKYVYLFHTTPEEIKQAKEKNRSINMKVAIEEQRSFLERNQADTFAGILQHLDKSAEEMEQVIECYEILERSKTERRDRNIKQKICYILSNIVLYLLQPKSKHVKDYDTLSTLLLETLQDVGLSYSFPDPYYLAILLFWPHPSEQKSEIEKYVTAIRNSSRQKLCKLFNKRSTIAKLYLGKENDKDRKENRLKRLVTKVQLDEKFLGPMNRDTLAQQWWNGDIFKEKAIIDCLQRVNGNIEQGEVYAIYGNLKIHVRPARIGWIRRGYSTEKVSFFLGFALNGPLAYDIKYEN